MTRLIRSLGAAAVVALVALAGPGASPAIAAAPSVTINSPVADSVVSAPFAITGSVNQDGNDGVIDSVTIRLSSDDGWGAPQEKKYPGTSGVFSGGGANVSYNWASIKPAYNGPYTVTVEAVGRYRTLTGYTEPATNRVSKTFHVRIAPVKPTGVSASKAEGSTIVTVKWTANPEPDIAGYEIFRSFNGGSDKPVGAVDGSKTSWQDDLAGAPGGQYRYVVVAVRHKRSCKSSTNTDEACTTGISSEKSAPSGAITLQATAPTTTTTTTKKPSGGGGGSGGGTGGSGGGSTGGGTSGGSTSGGTSSGNPAGVKRGTGGTGYAAGGEVDLSKFGSLLNPTGSVNSTRRPGEPEGTYDPSLPYGERPLQQSNNDDDDSLVTIGGASIPKPSDDWVKFIGAGSLATALLVHVLWFKQQVDQIPLETID